MLRRTAVAARAPAWRASPLDLVVAVVTVLGVLALVVSFAAEPWWDSLRAEPEVYAVLGLALLVAELRPIPISRGDDTVDHITISTTFTVALLAIGPLSLALAAQVLAVVAGDLRGSSTARKVVFNAAQYVLSMTAARLAFAAVAEDVGFHDRHLDYGTRFVLPTLVAGAVFVVTNHLLVACAVSLETGVPFREVAAQDAMFSLTTSAVLISLAPVAAFVSEASVWMLLLLLLPMLAVHRSAAHSMLREQMALHDPLTGLGTRVLLRMRGDRLLADSDASAGPSIVVVDLDHFDDINDSYGLPTGDAVLVEVAIRIRATVPDDALVCRLGDQFAILLPAGRAGADGLSANLLRVLDAPAELGDVRLMLQASIGVAVAPEHGQDMEVLLKNASVALHDPARRRDRATFYRPDADQGTLERLRLLSELRTAVDERQFVVVFQPQISVETGHLVGAEALVRWNHPTRGMVPPDVFIGLAENSGLITPMTAVVLDEALGALARLRRAGHELRMAVNMSARHMSDLTLPQLVRDALSRHGIPAHLLTLEVTETGILSEPASVDAVVRDLRELGVSIAVDDYGTGHASLSYLKRLDIDELKIDKSFVIDMGNDTGDAIIVRSTIELGHDLGLRIVAEGVEDAETLAMLARLGSDYAQGWHIGRPMPEHDLRAMLDRWGEGPGWSRLRAGGRD